MYPIIMICMGKRFFYSAVFLLVLYMYICICYRPQRRRTLNRDTIGEHEAGKGLYWRAARALLSCLEHRLETMTPTI